MLTAAESPAVAPADAPGRVLAAIARMPSMPSLLKVLGDMTGMGCVVVAMVTQDRWIACAVLDRIAFGLTPGGELDVDTTLCKEVRSTLTPIIIEHASRDIAYRNHCTIAIYGIESYIAVPIFMPDGRLFGTLCAVDPQPARLAEPKMLSMFEEFARMIAAELHEQLEREREHEALIDERAMSELREQFIAILGHDLRNPLQALMASCDLLAKRQADEWTEGLAGRMKANVRRMSLLIDDVLDFARGRLGGGIGVQIATAANLDAGLEAIVRELQDSHPQRTIISDIRVRRPVRCDVGRVQQLVSNLLGNALVHGSPAAPVRFSVMAEDDLVMEVWNDGEPIPQDSIGKIFSPFWRRETAANRDGLGLGLHICSQIVSAHNGQISVLSSKDAGTKFTVRLPGAVTAHLLSDLRAGAG